MDFNNHQVPKQTVPANYFITLSLVMGILSIVTAFVLWWTVYLPMFLGALGAIFAILSKGSDREFPPQSKIGFISGIVGITLNIAILITMFYFLLSDPTSKKMLIDTYKQTYESIYGETFDESISDTIDDIL